MSRRNRDYSQRYDAGAERYHSFRTGRGSGGWWVKPLATVVSGLIVFGVGRAAEVVGDSIEQRNDKPVYDSESDIQQALFHAEVVKTAGKVLALTIPNSTRQEIPTINKAFSHDFEELANASMPGGLPSDTGSYIPFRYDLEWDGYAGKNNGNAPDTFCRTIELPEEAIGAYVWQASQRRATAQLDASEEGRLSVDLCQYGKNNTPTHHHIAVMAIQAGSR